MDLVAAGSGLGSADSLRQHLTRRVGLTPSAYRRSFTRLSPPQQACWGTRGEDEGIRDEAPADLRSTRAAVRREGIEPPTR